MENSPAVTPDPAMVLYYRALSTEARNKELLRLVQSNMCRSPEEVLALISAGADVEASTESGATALHMAARNSRSPTMMDILIANNASLDVKDKGQHMALHHAAEGGHTRAIRTLIRQGALIDPVDVEGLTPLFRAVLRGCDHDINLLLDNGASVTLLTHKGESVLHLAMRRPCSEIVFARLLQHGAPVDATDAEGHTVLSLCISRSEAMLALLLIANGASYDAPTLQKLLRDPKLLPHILAIPNCNGAMKLNDLAELLAARLKRDESIEHPPRDLSMTQLFQLIADECSSDPSTPTTLLEDAVAPLPAHCNAMLYLLALNCGKNQNLNAIRQPQGELTSDNPICSALRRKGLLRAFLEAEEGVATLANKPAEKTPLTWAAEHGQLSMVKLILDLGANINFPDATGETPLHLAARFGRLDIVAFLLERGARKNPIDLDERSPAQIAKLAGHQTIAGLITNANARTPRAAATSL